MDWIKNIISDIKFNITNNIQKIIDIFVDNKTIIFTMVGVGLVIFIIYSIIMDDDYLR
jgi:hypothetical protein